MKKFVPVLLISTLLLIASSIHAQLEWVRVVIDCPCTLESEDGKTATVTFGLTNNEVVPTDNLYATIAVTGHFEDEEFAEEKSAFLGTVALNRGLSANGKIPVASYEVEFGKLPAGEVFFELLVHEGPLITLDSLLDFVWFEGETVLPFTSISKENLNFLADTDADGVGDANERFEGTDPLDATDYPRAPTIDVVVVHDSSIDETVAISDPIAYFSHVIAVSEYLFERSGASLSFRIVDVLDEETIPEILDDELFLPRERRDELVEEYGADVVVAYHPGSTGLCGIAEDIGGWRGRGFVHRLDRAILTHLFLNPRICPINVTAHEIGHLMGLGHSYVQGAIGTFYWSRGHGVPNEFGTVMSYAGFDYNGIDVDKFSNPHEDCHGKPCGISHELPNHDQSADAVLSVNITKYQVAATEDPSSTVDVDGDGFAADVDEFPLDPNEWYDSDGDGYGNNTDRFPNDISEWSDTDSDGVGDNSDPDIDNDGVANISDADPFDPNIKDIRFLSIVSDYKNDAFGLEVVRIHDLDQDSLNDIAISAPGTLDSDLNEVGAIYLLSFDQLVETQRTPNGNARTQRILSEFVTGEKAWVIRGTSKDQSLGEHMLYLPSDEGTGLSGMLLFSSRDTVYLIQLDTPAMHEFDALDGSQDRKLNLGYCTDSPICWDVGENNDFDLQGMATMHDRDRDSIADFAVIGARYGADDVSIYLLTTGSITSFAMADHSEQNVFDVLVSTCEDCYRIISAGARSDVNISDIGDVTGYIGTELGIGMNVGTGSGFGNIGAGGEDSSAAYVLNTELAEIFDLIDGMQDGEIMLGDFIGGDLGSYKLTRQHNALLVRNIDQIADLDGDNRPEVMIWSGSDPHIVLSSQSFVSLDERDDSADGNIVLDDNSLALEGVWQVDSLNTVNHRTQRVFPTLSDQNSNLLMAQTDADIITAVFENLSELDNPDEDTRDSYVDLRARLGQLGVFELVNKRDLRRHKPLSGLMPLGDIDSDSATDYMFATTTQDANYFYTSTLEIIFTSSLAILDRADGVEDGVASLHNNLYDTDLDGILNIHDIDDDNDGAPDTYDAYPLHADAIYDIDGDQVADSIDQFPRDPYVNSDLDFDGIADNYDDDIDGDGILNFEDDHPRDTDNDGIDNIFDDDDDGDGVADVDDEYPIDPTEQYDSDGDGYADNVDLFAHDASEWEDFDSDGIGDNRDLDDDNDGIEDTHDQFPRNASEWADTDGDGVGDNSDPFPNNPFEWEDIDGDGIGDYLKGASIASYRIESVWSRVMYFTSDYPTAYALRGFNVNEQPTLVLQSTAPADLRGPVQVLSRVDLAELDMEDQHRDSTIDVSLIANGSESWELRGSYSSYGFIHQNRGTILDLNSDSVTDLLMSNPVEDFGNGMITVVNGATLSEADVFDGTADGKINYVQCVRDHLCTSIVASDGNYFGFSTTALKGLFGPTTWGVVATNLYASEWHDDEMQSTPMILLMSTDSITQLTEGLTDSVLSLDTVIQADDVLRIYSEFSRAEASAYNVQVTQLADYDGDGAEELLVEYPSKSSIYFLASQDILAADSHDGNLDGRVSVASIVSGVHSYRLDGYALSSNHARTSGVNLTENSSQLISLQSLSGFETILLDVTELASNDSADGETDGIISEISVTDTSSWRVEGVSDISLCNDSLNVQDTLVIGNEQSYYESSKFHLFDIDTLQTIVDEQGIRENVVNVPEVAANGTYDIWTIRLGDQLSKGLASYNVACAGDFDEDEIEDVVLSMTISKDYSTVQTSTILLMSTDLATIDKLDGNEDQDVDLSLLWRIPDTQ